MNFLQMSRSGAVMILVIVVIRALAINKLPKKAFLVLWGVVTVRLLIPYSLPSAFSVYSLLEQLAPATEAVKDMAAFTPTIPARNVTPMPGTSAVHTEAVLIDPWTVVWLVGGLVCAVFFVVAYLKCRREFMASLGLLGRIPLKVDRAQVGTIAKGAVPQKRYTGWNCHSFQSSATIKGVILNFLYSFWNRNRSHCGAVLKRPGHLKRIPNGRNPLPTNFRRDDNIAAGT